MKVILLITTILVAVVLSAVRWRREDFRLPQAHNLDIKYVNDGEEPWSRHPISSLHQNLDITIKYPKAYYYELDNSKMEAALAICLQTGVYLPSETLEWTTVDFDGTVLSAYNDVLNVTRTLLNTGARAFVLPDGSSKPFAVVHDVLVGSHATQDRSIYSFKYELILFRESKPYGKHVQCAAVVDIKNMVAYFVQAKVVGSVPADTMGLFPIMSYDPTNITNSKLTPI